MRSGWHRSATGVVWALVGVAVIGLHAVALITEVSSPGVRAHSMQPAKEVCTISRPRLEKHMQFKRTSPCSTGYLSEVDPLPASVALA